MRGAVVVAEQADFDTWLGNQPTFAELNDRAAGDPVVGAAQYAVCAACHGQQGEGLVAMNAPKLAGQDPWYLERELKAFKQGLRGTHEDDTYGRQMAPMANTLPDQAAVANVVAHIGTLPDDPAPATIEGDVVRGAEIAAVCSYCHGRDGMGNEAVNAPRYAGQNDWYLARQLKHFKSGVRGSHPQDYYGKQMGFMGRILRDEQAINDVVAYINTLGAETGADVASAEY
jgi:cytochrome c oxidase subunit 2